MMIDNPRLWIGALAVACFAAGLTAGAFLTESRAEARSEAARGAEVPFADYRRAMVERFQLEPERERLFAEVLRTYQQGIDDAGARLLREHRPELERELADLGARYQAYIRDHVLPPERRSEFDALSAEWRTLQ
ncbi:MAG: hypothetical protein NTV21_05420 [Planctomycetota bacterium]|nr:hypothetical protein [Planctomycetota bacterium]